LDLFWWLSWIRIEQKAHEIREGLVPLDQALGEKIRHKLERLKWSLWHGNVYKALHQIEDIEILIDNFAETYPKFKQLTKAIETRLTVKKKAKKDERTYRHPKRHDRREDVMSFIYRPLSSTAQGASNVR
jgi:hypothetical protein